MSSSPLSLPSASRLLAQNVIASASEYLPCYSTDHPDSSATPTQSQSSESSGEEWYESEAQTDDATPLRTCARQRRKRSHAHHRSSQYLSSRGATAPRCTSDTEFPASRVPAADPSHVSGDFDLTAAAVVALQLTSPILASHDCFSTPDCMADDDARSISPLMLAPTPGFETHHDVHADGQLVMKRESEHEVLMSEIRSFEALGISFDLSDFDALGPEQGDVGHDIFTTHIESMWQKNAATTASRSDCNEETRASGQITPAVTLNDAGGQVALSNDDGQCALGSRPSPNASRPIEPSLIPEHESTVQPPDSTVILSTSALCSHGMHPDEASKLVRRTQLWLGLLPSPWNSNAAAPAPPQCRSDTRIASRLELLAWIAAERLPMQRSQAVI